MVKRILTLIIALSLICIPVYAQEEGADSGVTAMDGDVTISCATDAEEGTPVAVFILPAILQVDGGEERDITAQKVEEVASPQELAELGVEYAAIVKAGADGKITHSCKMKDSLTTGKCHVVFTFIDAEKAYIAGSFEHVGKDDVNALVSKFNEADASGYFTIVDEDVNGELEEDGVERKQPKNILGKSSADLEYYYSLTDKTTFHNLFFSFKPQNGFSAVSGSSALSVLVSAFNETGAWLKLRSEENTFSVLDKYNGEGIGKYWNIDISEDSDFASLSPTEKSSILTSIKGAALTERESLEKLFTDSTVLALFRGITTRTAMEELIKEDGKYASYFSNVRTILENTGLSAYEISEVYNKVLLSNSTCNSIENIEKLFTDSLPAAGNGGDLDGEDSGIHMGTDGVHISNGTSSGAGGGGTRNNYSENKIEEGSGTPSTKSPFIDVEGTHWANEYITRLYENGAINGVGESNFNPGGSVMRQDFVKILIGALGTELSENKSDFSDVEDGAYYSDYIVTAMEKGFITGTGEGSFGVGMNLKREDAAVIMARVLDNCGIEPLRQGMTFNDDAQISDYARDSIKKVAAMQIFTGDDKGNFNPRGNLTRAEACAILCRLADAVKEV